MLIPNCLFRSNGSAVVLSNRPRDVPRAKYTIRNLVRTNLAADDVAFNCVMQTEDDEGKVSGGTQSISQAGGQAGEPFRDLRALLGEGGRQPEHGAPRLSIE